MGGWLPAVKTRLESVDAVRAATVGLALLAAAVSLLATTELFPYRSLNHDEGVYLQQAELFLEGKLYLQPPVPEAFRPWFFVGSEAGFYPKYAPVPAMVFALGRLLGGYPLALAAVSAAVVGLTVELGRELFDARTGLLAGLFLLASPLFLIHSGVYLPYAVTTAFNLAFALAYLRGERTGSRRAATVAGAAVGIAFFARPYTAVLFALPFVVHACVTLVRSGAWRTPFVRDAAAEEVADAVRALFTRRLVTASLGTAGVLVALGYNAVVTGDPLVFPYQAFAPEDGIGFGHRQILGHEERYTLELALESNRRVLTQLFTEWVVAGVLGSALAAAGVLVTAGKRAMGDLRGRDATHAALLAGLFVTVPAGNVAFWGNFNVLGALSEPDDGLIHFLGPYYHYDLLVPTAVFAAVAVVTGTHWLGRLGAARLGRGTVRQLSLAALVVSAGVVGAVAVPTAAGPIERNAGVSEELSAAYDPVEAWAAEAGTGASLSGTPEDALLYLPTVYGRWLNHPFQALRNDATYDGTVYALADVDELAVAGAFPDRTLYRYVVRGAWNPTDGAPVTADVRRVHRATGERLRLDASLGIPPSAESVTIRASGDAGSAYYVANATLERLQLDVTVADGEAWVSGPTVEASGGDGRFPVEAQDELEITVFVSTGPGAGSGFSYRLVFPVATSGGEIRALSATEERCPVPDRCVPAGLGPSPDWALVETDLENETA